MIYILIVLSVALLFTFRVMERRSRADNWALGGTGVPMTEEAKKEWYDLSWNGQNPWRVIRLGSEMAMGMSNSFMQQKHLASCFYSQVKHLVKKGHIPTAIAFFWEARALARSALEWRQMIPQEERNPIDLEVLGAPDFMLAQIPVFGTFFKKQALMFLNRAEDEIPFTRDDNESLAAALIWSKIYALTKDETYKDYIRLEGLHRKMDNHQLARVSKHLGFGGSVDRLLEFCSPRY